jgi:hypothetical protein
MLISVGLQKFQRIADSIDRAVQGYCLLRWKEGLSSRRSSCSITAPFRSLLVGSRPASSSEALRSLRVAVKSLRLRMSFALSFIKCTIIYRTFSGTAMFSNSAASFRNAIATSGPPRGLPWPGATVTGSKLASRRTEAEAAFQSEVK